MSVYTINIKVSNIASMSRLHVKSAIDTSVDCRLYCLLFSTCPTIYNSEKYVSVVAIKVAGLYFTWHDVNPVDTCCITIHFNADWKVQKRNFDTLDVGGDRASDCCGSSKLVDLLVIWISEYKKQAFNHVCQSKHQQCLKW